MSKPKFKIVVGRGRPVTKLALLAVIVLSTLTLLAIDGAADREREKAEAARAQAAPVSMRVTWSPRLRAMTSRSRG